MPSVFEKVSDVHKNEQECRKRTGKIAFADMHATMDAKGNTALAIVGALTLARTIPDAKQNDDIQVH